MTFQRVDEPEPGSAGSRKDVPELAAGAIGDVAPAPSTAPPPERLLPGLVEAAPVVLLGIDPSGVIDYANPATDRLLGYPPGELIGCAVAKILPEGLGELAANDPQDGQRIVTASRRGGERLPLELRIGHAGDGDHRVVIASGMGAAARLRQSLERRARELRRTNDELRQFAHVASHDLRQPLRTIGGFTDLLVRHIGDDLDEVGKEYAGFVRDGVNRMQEMIGDLLAYAELGDQRRSMRLVDTAEVARSVLLGLKQAIDDAGAEVRTGDLPEVIGDQTQLAVLLQNLIDNAIKFRGEDHRPVVRLAAERQGHAWLFQVTDNGIGIEPAHAERIFRMFQRLHTNGKYEGSGIGLASAKKIVERHGGRLWLESTPGEGTTFYFTIPDLEHRLVSTVVEGDDQHPDVR